MSGVPAVLLDQVEDQPAQAGVPAVVVAGVDQLVQPAVGQGGVQPGAGPIDGAVPQGVQLLRAVVGGRAEGPVGVGVPVDGLPGCAGRDPAAQLDGEGVVLDEREVLEQLAERQVRGPDPGLQAGRVEVAGLPTEGGAQPVERAEQLLGLGAREGRFPGEVAVGHARNRRGHSGRSTSGVGGLPSRTGRVQDDWID